MYPFLKILKNNCRRLRFNFRIITTNFLIWNKFPYMKQPYRRYFVRAYFMRMATKPTAFHSIPPRGLVIYLKFWIFVITKSVIVLQRRVYARNMKYMYYANISKFFWSGKQDDILWKGCVPNLMKPLYGFHAHLIINWEAVRFQIKEQNHFPVF